jgi:hypothetical protein
MSTRDILLTATSTAAVSVDDTPAGDRPWLTALTARFGEPRVHAGPIRIFGGTGCIRECWVWFPGGRNHNMALDQYPDHWVIQAAGDGSHAEARLAGTDAPSAAAIRAVLVAARLLEG